jgi:tetratricopeptide (TPR) repeat protein
MKMNRKKTKTKTKPTKKIIRSTWPIIITVILAAFLVRCGGGTRVNLDVYIPDLDRSQDSDSYYSEGWKNLKDGKTQQAVKNFDRSNLGEEQLLVGYGYVYLAENKLGAARANFEKCLGINPENVPAQYGLANIYELLKENERAFQVYSKLRAAYPGDSRVKSKYEFIKTTETQGYMKQADKFKNEKNMPAYIGALETASFYSPEIVKIKVEIADFYTSQFQYEKASHFYEEVLEKLPNDENISMKLADVYEKISRYDSAILIYKKIQELKPADKTISRKIDELKARFNESKLPDKFKNIFFKETINREEVAALIGHYFDNYLEPRQPLIITDIGNSFAKDYIIKVCSLEIMQLRPDHSFDRFTVVNRASFAVIADSLLKYLEKSARTKNTYSVHFTPAEKTIEPADISRLHKDYEVIMFLLNSGIIKLDANNNFNPTLDITPSEVLIAVQKILNSVRPYK